MSEHGQAAFAAYYAPLAGSPVVMPDSWDMQPSGIRDAWDAAGQAVLNQAFPGLRRQLDEAREQLAAAVNPTAEDYDHAAEILELREQLAGVRERLENLAAGLEMSARTSQPSKKSEIEQGCAAAVRGIAAQIGDGQ